MSVFLGALRREISELERSLESDPRFIKLRELQKVAALYRPGGSLASLMNIGRLFVGSGPDLSVDALPSETPSASPSSPAPSPAQAEEPTEVGTPRTRKETTAMREAMLVDLKNYLKGRTGPTRTSELYDFIKLAGYDLGGKDPKNNLSAILSRTKDVFVSHGKAGWTLAEDGEDQALPEAVDAG